MTRLSAQIEEILLDTTSRLSSVSDRDAKFRPRGSAQFPSVDALKKIISIVKAVVFPDFFDARYNNPNFRSSYIGVNIERLYTLLVAEIEKAMCFDSEAVCDSAHARQLAAQFIDGLPEIKRMLLTDAEAMYGNDPAADNFAEIILCYPTVHAMTHYRAAHALLRLGIPVLPRVLTELAHSDTGIDINPGAEIGEYFAIDHGTGVVVGQTAVIGNHVTLYQGVTLGAKNFTLDDDGHPLNLPRHPILEDNVTVYSNASILGRITVGHDSVIGGNIWLTHSVPPGSRIVQNRGTDAPK